MTNYYEVRQYLEDVFLKIYKSGCNAALVEIARINMTPDEELKSIADSKGIDISHILSKPTT